MSLAEKRSPGRSRAGRREARGGQSQEGSSEQAEDRAEARQTQKHQLGLSGVRGAHGRISAMLPGGRACRLAGHEGRRGGGRAGGERPQPPGSSAASAFFLSPEGTEQGSFSLVVRGSGTVGFLLLRAKGKSGEGRPRMGARVIWTDPSPAPAVTSPECAQKPPMLLSHWLGQ